MKNTLLLAFSLLLLASCQPDELVDTVVPDDACGAAGARVQATVDGSEWCANASVIGVSDGSSATITGINTLGGTLMLQLDSLATGPQAITEASNALLFMNLGQPYTPLTTDPGVLTIATLDTVAHTVTGSFEVTLHTDGGGSKPVSGAFDVHYQQQ